MTRRELLALALAGPFAGLLPKPEWPPHLSPLPGEVYWWLDSKDWVFTISDSPNYEFWFTGFKPGDEQKVVGQLRMVTHLARRPLVSRMLKGIE